MAKATAAFSVTIKVRMQHVPGTLGRLATAIGEAGGNISAMQSFDTQGEDVIEDIIVDASSEAHVEEICDAVRGLEGVEVLEALDRTFAVHQGGKLETVGRFPLLDRDDLSMAYTPGVARVCNAIAADPRLVHELTIKKNTVAIVTDGTAVLGLGDIGPEAALPVMEGKALLFKEFGGVDAFPVCLDVDSVDELVETVVRIAPVFGGVNLEDIAAPAAFEVENRLREALDIPVFHDDQHGTAVVALAALENALRIVGKRMDGLRVVISGAGAAGVATAKILQSAGVDDIVLADRNGAIHIAREDLNESKRWLAENLNPADRRGSIGELLVGADVFLGVSGPGVVTPEEIGKMADAAIVFAMANPNPEVVPEEIAGLAAVIATGRSDYPNQINNVLAFPGIFRGALDSQATTITEGMKLAAAEAIASVIAPEELTANNIIPSVFDRRVGPLVAERVADAARADGVTRT